MTAFDRSKPGAGTCALGREHSIKCQFRGKALGKRWIRGYEAGPSPPKPAEMTGIKNARTHNNPLSVTQNAKEATP